MKNITKTEKYKKLKYEVSKNKHTTDKDKNNQIHSQIKIHNAHLNNINKIGKYKQLKTQKQGELKHRVHFSWFDWFFLTMIEKRSKRRWKKGISIFVKSIAVTKNWFVVSNFWEFPKHLTEK